jgi:hypothetical protein
VFVDSAFGDHQLLGDRRVAEPFGHQREYLVFAWRQPVQRTAPLDHQLADHLRVEHGPARGHPPYRLDELVDPGHPVLQQVADAFAAGRKQFGRVDLLDVLREHQHGQAGLHPARLDRRAEALVGEGRRKAYVDHRDIDLVRRDRPRELVRVGGDRGDLEAGVVQQQAEPLGEDRVVLEDHHPHGRITSRVVGPPIGLSSSI